MLFKLFNNIFINKINTIKIKANITNIYNEKTIFEDKKEYKMENMTNVQENFNCGNLSIK